ncbi:Uncharacterised protein [Klebsiella pneumoniae]|nr:Uncharacterised protein [Klebsiella pneumoniae]
MKYLRLKDVRCKSVFIAQFTHADINICLTFTFKNRQ